MSKQQRGAARQKLTTDVVRKLATGNIRGQRVCDAELSGFGVTVYPSGKKTFWCRYGPRNRRRFTTIGTWGKISAEQARKRAKELLAQAELGADPVFAQQQQRRVPLFTEWIEAYKLQVQHELKPSTIANAFRYFRLAIEHLGNKPIDELLRSDLLDARLLIAERHGNVTANRWLSTIRTCLNEAMACGHLHGNPASGIKRLRENPPRQRILDDDEMQRLMQAIDGLSDPHTRCAFLLLIGTGARRGEVLHARWEHLNLHNATWHLPDPKAGRPQVILLSAAVVNLLKATPRVPGSPWVVPATTDPLKHRYSLSAPWQELCRAAKITGARVHDLRRTFGANIAKKAGLHVAQRLLRHSDIRITESVYAPIDEHTLRKALKAEVVPLAGNPGPRESG